jgi:hypothetical protein
VPVDRVEPAFADVEEAEADRRPDPFVQIEADEIHAEIGDLEIELAP